MNLGSCVTVLHHGQVQYKERDDNMIIDRKGNILGFFLRENGIVVKDGDFSICLEYDAKQKVQYAQIAELKAQLAETDYKALKYSDGSLTEEEYAPIREQRQIWRDAINEIERTFSEPTITREEMSEAEKIALEKMRGNNNV